ncbi:hypothetical protein K0U00_05130, partial [Paenibacillus sepulcri]|nr:hypothetical protein [Paenibacillus sepulcri]
EEAVIRFAIWKLNPGSSEQRTAALSLNEDRYRKSGKQEYLDRCRELSGLCHAAAAHPLQKHTTEIIRSKRISPGMLDEIDRFLNG